MAKKSGVLDNSSNDKQHDYFADTLPWQQIHWQRLVSRFPNIPHAFLLSGQAGTGKRQFADQLAAWLLCQKNAHLQKACGECASCQWLKANTHPNLIRISPEVDSKGKASQFIKIDQIRELLPFVQQTGEGRRVVIIEPAESLNIAAANALLKTLEEPGVQVTLILVSDQPLQLPATIRSRLQQYKVGQVSPEQAYAYVEQHVQGETKPNVEQTQLLLNLSAGAPLAAIQLAQQAHFLARQDWVDDWLQLLKQRTSPIQLSGQWQKRLNLSSWLELLQWMLRDVIALHLRQPVLQTDLKLDEIASKISLDELFAIQQQIFLSISGQSQNIQSGLVYDSLMMQLMNVHEPA